MNHLITPELTDRILNFLITHIELGDDRDLTSGAFPVTEGVDADTIDVIIQDLHQQGLIELLNRGHSGYDYSYDISITKKALDLQRLGGFVGQEILLKKSLRQLLAELKNLNLPAGQEKKIAEIADNINAYLVQISSAES